MSCQEFEGLAGAVCDRLDRVEPTLALDEVCARQAPQPLRQDEQPWQLAKDEGALASIWVLLLAGVARGLRSVASVHARRAERLLGALGREDLSLERARLGAIAGGARTGELGQLFPKVEPGGVGRGYGGRVIDRRARWSTPTAISIHCEPSERDRSRGRP